MCLASINIDCLTDVKWDMLTNIMATHDPPIAACAIQHHSMGEALGHLDMHLCTPWFNKCGEGPTGAPAGGVGWVINRQFQHMFSDHTANGEGENIKWVRMGRGNYLASVYIPPNATHSAVMQKVHTSMTAKMHTSAMWVGDINCDMRRDATAEAENPPTMQDVEAVVKDASRKLFKSAGPDGITNWMIVWGGQIMLRLLHALYTAV